MPVILTRPMQTRRGLASETKECNNCSEKCFTEALYCRWCILLDKIAGLEGLDLSNIQKYTECCFCDGPAYVQEIACEFCLDQFDEGLYTLRYGEYELQHREQHEAAKALVIVPEGVGIDISFEFGNGPAANAFVTYRIWAMKFQPHLTPRERTLCFQRDDFVDTCMDRELSKKIYAIAVANGCVQSNLRIEENPVSTHFSPSLL